MSQNNYEFRKPLNINNYFTLKYKTGIEKPPKTQPSEYWSHNILIIGQFKSIIKY